MPSIDRLVNLQITSSLYFTFLTNISNKDLTIVYAIYKYLCIYLKKPQPIFHLFRDVQVFFSLLPRLPLASATHSPTLPRSTLPASHRRHLGSAHVHVVMFLFFLRSSSVLGYIFSSFLHPCLAISVFPPFLPRPVHPQPRHPSSPHPRQQSCVQCVVRLPLSLLSSLAPPCQATLPTSRQAQLGPAHVVLLPASAAPLHEQRIR